MHKRVRPQKYPASTEPLLTAASCTTHRHNTTQHQTSQDPTLSSLAPGTATAQCPPVLPCTVIQQLHPSTNQSSACTNSTAVQWQQRSYVPPSKAAGLAPGQAAPAAAKQQQHDTRRPMHPSHVPCWCHWLSGQATTTAASIVLLSPQQHGCAPLARQRLARAAAGQLQCIALLVLIVLRGAVQGRRQARDTSSSSPPAAAPCGLWGGRCGAAPAATHACGLIKLQCTPKDTSNNHEWHAVLAHGFLPLTLLDYMLQAETPRTG
jgi:hypothetical protein